MRFSLVQWWNLRDKDKPEWLGMGQYLARIAAGWLIADAIVVLFTTGLRFGGGAKLFVSASIFLLLVFWIVGPICFFVLWFREGSRRDSIVDAERQKQRDEDRLVFDEQMRRIKEKSASIRKRIADEEARQAELKAVAEREAKDLVYFIVNRAENTVKIGISTSPEKRLRQLQTSNPHRLELAKTLPGGYSKERQLHEKYATHRIGGEWFHLVPEILEQINCSENQPKLKVA